MQWVEYEDLKDLFDIYRVLFALLVCSSHIFSASAEEPDAASL